MSFSVVPLLKARVMAIKFVQNNPKVQELLNHPAGPFTIHFWAPTMKWGITFANIADLKRRPDLISTPQQIAVAGTGLIWSRYSMVITPKNWNLFSVNIFMAATGLIQLYRKATYKPLGAEGAETAKPSKK